MAIDRKAARAAYRERRQDWQVYAVRIGARVWVGVTPDLAAATNRLDFMLRQGAAPVAAMSAAYSDAGRVETEALERLDPDLRPLARADAAKARRAHWCDVLGAEPLPR